MTFVAYIYSQPVEGRYISIFKAISGQVDSRYYSSSAKRLDRAKVAFKSIIKTPLGTGWGSQGWVHSDILQIGSSVGIIPGVIFLFAPMLLLIKTYRYYLTAVPAHKTVFFTLCGLLIFMIISLGLNGNMFLVQSGVPLFLVWALAYSYGQNYYISL